ncbi:MAG: hypothetical protein PF904_15960 [Kiritimatiellae bacterium]|jgi:hypothetical protein|nr:hypothetical protein [Kiritimatiellia bacterium]
MKSPMLPKDHQKAVKLALELGRRGDPTQLSRLIRATYLPSNEIQRLAASGIGKLAEFGADSAIAVTRLAELAFKGRHPQTQQYAIRALKKYGAAGSSHVQDLLDMARNPALKDYVRAAAKTTADAIALAASDVNNGVQHRCLRCNTVVSDQEFERSMEAFQRCFCDRCFDEVFLIRRNFEMQVEINKTVEAQDGTLVQSKGEKMIAEWLTAHRLSYRYDTKFRIIGEFQIRPDFYMPEIDVYIEYWGLDTPKYKMSMYKKQMLYQQEGKRLISVYPKDLSVLDALLRSKLSIFGCVIN